MTNDNFDLLNKIKKLTDKNKLFLERNSYKDDQKDVNKKFKFSGLKYKLKSIAVNKKYFNPYFNIILNKNNKGIKNTLINLKGYRAIKKNKLFDINYYLKNNGDVRLSRIDPVLHYIYHGYNEGRKPNPSFDGDLYLKKYGDVQRSNLNPLVHYSLYGIKEDREININVNLKNLVLSIEELKYIELPLDELFSLQINHNDVKYEFLIKLSSHNKNLICFGSGAYEPEKLSPPIYYRHSWHSQLEESVINYNDPTLYVNPKIRLGWGVGRNEEWYLSVIAKIILIISKKMEIKNKDILFFGSSGGGFTSIILSTLIRNSQAMVNHPQFFCNKWKGHFEKVINFCFDDLDSETILTKYGYRFNVIELFNREKYMPPITYLINIDSKLDTQYQLIPFINSLNSFKYFNPFNILVYQNDNEHNGLLNMDETIKLIKNHFRKRSHPS
jgi:hypothetical protein